jgi:hypothetical protein
MLQYTCLERHVAGFFFKKFVLTELPIKFSGIMELEIVHCALDSSVSRYGPVLGLWEGSQNAWMPLQAGNSFVI